MQTHQEKVQIIEIWLRDICPLGLLTRSGRLAPADANLIEEYVRRNHQDQELFIRDLERSMHEFVCARQTYVVGLDPRKHCLSRSLRTC